MHIYIYTYTHTQVYMCLGGKDICDFSFLTAKTITFNLSFLYTDVKRFPGNHRNAFKNALCSHGDLKENQRQVSLRQPIYNLKLWGENYLKNENMKQ